jgi:threonine dehydratase
VTPSCAKEPTLVEVLDAHERLRLWLEPSPLVPLGALHLKAEYQQPTGSFKVRGALVALSRTAERSPPPPLVAASAGNHGLGVAWAAARLGLHATVVIPRDCPAVKADELRRLTRVHVAPHDGYDAAERLARQVAAETGAVFLSPFDDTWIMAGNGGTLALELLAQRPDLGTLIVPVGGGGLLSGLLVVLAHRAPHVEVVAVQSEASPAFVQSLADRRCHTTWPAAETLAEGLEGGAGERSVLLALEHGITALAVPEHAIAAAMVRLTDALGAPIEGSAAVVEAAREEGLLERCPPPWVGVLTGGNVSMSTIDRLRGATS